MARGRNSNMTIRALQRISVLYFTTHVLQLVYEQEDLVYTYTQVIV